jgi:hypothetical protein
MLDKGWTTAAHFLSGRTSPPVSVVYSQPAVRVPDGWTRDPDGSGFIRVIDDKDEAKTAPEELYGCNRASRWWMRRGDEYVPRFYSE